ncbi:MAG: DUF5723 family protein [Flavobacteriales bacterium]
MKINYLTALLLCAATGASFAQDSTAAKGKTKIEAVGNLSINSTALNASFYNGFGGFINDELKDQASRRLTKNNLAGMEMEARVNYYAPAATGKWGVYAGVSENLDLGIDFTEDAFRVMFYGTANYIGKTSDFSGTKVRFMMSQALHFGVHRNFANNANIQLGLNIVKGQNWFDLTIDKGSLHLNEDDYTFDIVMKGNMNRSDTAHAGLDAFNGIGAGLNFSYTKERANGARFSFGLANLGLMQWNQNTIHNETDTTFHYDGYQVNNIFAIGDSLVNNMNVQTLESHTHPQKGSRMMALPFTLRVTYLHPLNNKSYLTADINYKYWSTYIPKLMVSYGYKFGQHFGAEVSTGYGGYGQLHAGVHARLEVKGFQLRGGISDLLGLISPSIFSNQGGYLLASYSF